MHELAITEEVVRIANEKAQELGASRVTRIELHLGALSGIVADSVAFYFEHLGKGTLCEAAGLEFIRITARARCRNCRGEFEPAEFDWTCPDCDHVGADLLAGREMAVANIEIEES
jgi:hydrogenase nickel incorporation protein HypA/HybF